MLDTYCIDLLSHSGPLYGPSRLTGLARFLAGRPIQLVDLPNAAGDGGYLVPPEFLNDLLDLTLQYPPDYQILPPGDQDGTEQDSKIVEQGPQGVITSPVSRVDPS